MTAKQIVACPACHGRGKVALSWGLADCSLCATTGRVRMVEPQLVPWAAASSPPELPGPLAAAEQIVRALAAADPLNHEDGTYCPLCEGTWPMGTPMGARREAVKHRPDCPWRLAVEWVAANDRRAEGFIAESFKAWPHPVPMSDAEWAAARPWRGAIMVDVVVGDEQTRRRALKCFGPQFDVPEGATITAVYMQAQGGGPQAVELAEPVTGPGWFYFDAEARRLVPYHEADKLAARQGTEGGER